MGHLFLGIWGHFFFGYFEDILSLDRTRSFWFATGESSEEQDSRLDRWDIGTWFFLMGHHDSDPVGTPFVDGYLDGTSPFSEYLDGMRYFFGWDPFLPFA